MGNSCRQNNGLGGISVKRLYILVLILVLMLTGCMGKEEKVAELSKMLTDVVNIKYRGYMPETDDIVIDTVFSADLAEEIKATLESGLVDRDIVINNVIAEAEKDRMSDVLQAAYKLGVGYTPNPNNQFAIYDDEIIANYKAGKLDNLKNTELDTRIGRVNDNYTITLSQVKTEPDVEEIALNVYGHTYKVDISDYSWDAIYKGYAPYNFKLMSYIFYTDGTFEIDFESVGDVVDSEILKFTVEGTTTTSDGMTKIKDIHVVTKK